MSDIIRLHLFTIHSHFLTKYAGVAELADAPDLGSGGNPVQVQVLSPAPKKELRFISEALFIQYEVLMCYHALACM